MLPWPIYDLPSTIKKLKIGRDKQVPSTEIAGTGRFPVIDQGQSFIAGYHDDESKVIKENLPLIIFGDHTRCFKFANFPFILGADGTKILKPDEKLFDAKFYYYVLLGLDIPNRGYNRHFSLLKEKKIPRPELDEQRKIAAVLSLVQRAIEQQEQLIALTTELKKALMHKLFTEGLRGEPQKQTEIGPVPESWEVVALEDVAMSFDYGTSVKCDYAKAGFPVLRIPNVIGGSIDLRDLKFGLPKRNELESLRLRAGDLLFVRTNGVQENAGRCSLFSGELDNCYYASYLIRVRVDSAKLLPAFLNEYSQTECGRSFLAGRAIRTADGKFNINTGTLKKVLVPLPTIGEQQEITANLELLKRKRKQHEAKGKGLQDLFCTLLHQLMTAQIRVHDLDLSELEAVTKE
ncbi:MAG: restriction endonuclease subunit S [Bacillota bacterium]